MFGCFAYARTPLWAQLEKEAEEDEETYEKVACWSRVCLDTKTRFGFGCPEKARSLEILTVLLRQPLVAGSDHVASLVRCETNDKEKTAAIAEAEARITDLTSTIEELTATSARLNTEIKNLEAEIAKNQEASVVCA